MSLESLFGLHIILLPHIMVLIDEWSDYKKVGGRTGGNYLPPSIPNGLISSSVGLACAIRYFAGGSAYDIRVMFGILYRTILTNVWIIVQAINNTPQFFISYPNLLRCREKM